MSSINNKLKMNKGINAILLSLFTMLILVGIILIIKVIKGNSIIHYRQYMFQCQGQVAQPMNGIAFIFIDEEELSEMADVNNLKNVYITTDEGEKIEATKWDLEERALFTAPDEYRGRKLNLYLPYDRAYTITQLTIVYPDKEETFEVGNLKVIPIETDSWMRAGISCYAINLVELKSFLTDPDYVQEPDPEPFSTENLEAGRFNFFQAVGRVYSSEGSFTITKIDFGIEGMGIDPSTIRFLQGEECNFIGDTATFIEKEENKIYLERDILKSLPSQDISLSVTESKFSIYASIRKTESYHTELTCLYISPVYYCVDDATGKMFVYGNELNYWIKEPIFRYEEEYVYVIEEKGV